MSHLSPDPHGLATTAGSLHNFKWADQLDLAGSEYPVLRTFTPLWPGHVLRYRGFVMKQGNLQI
jgi:hypothetical protein